jgi:molecular chaperone HscA
MAAGAARIRVTFQVDADGLLSVSARELSTGVESHVTVKPSYGLSDAEIEQMLRDSITHARDDEAARALSEQQVDANRLIESVRSALASHGGTLLTAQEREVIEVALNSVERVRHGNDRQVIKQAVEALDAATQEFARRRMDAGIRQALAGHRIEEFAGSIPPDTTNK